MGDEKTGVMCGMLIGFVQNIDFIYLMILNE